jgi:hypothetical protein
MEWTDEAVVALTNEPVAPHVERLLKAVDGIPEHMKPSLEGRRRLLALLALIDDTARRRAGETP